MVKILEISDLVFMEKIHYPNISIEQGSIVFIQGPSGSGKSTLIRLINNTISPSSGRILFNGVNIEDIDSIDLRRKIILVGQSPYLFNTNIKENFILFHKFRETPFPEDKKLMEYLHICCANFPLDTQCINLSGGEKQRIFLAIALSFNPQILLLDEPTSALDSSTADCVMVNITQYCKENHITLLIVSHDTVLGEQYAEQIIRIGGMK